ncbi:solute carrier family 2, facilitated glucose transporter member 1-like [Paramacrobiotus metropolitanus]|uniref:solute carrier family 2, facilitated glucose transporter member 1-like n=1 Tax=Paramacrobiotus metropolitanus TaxID=2943436 RepID=UPI00244656D8|nr:solute carrier family 2, facilitated glucose transporter member 1-like [Paramacrobiotus metropolitanus]XP_055331121.1 solute carrier family 2, facilitated glucose transporter member 1-like [Paramacrobiotus metropolitanus]
MVMSSKYPQYVFRAIMEETNGTTRRTSTPSGHSAHKSFFQRLQHFRKELKEVTFLLMVTVLSAGFGSPFLIGYNTGVINVPQKVLSEWIRSTECEKARYISSHSGLNASWVNATREEERWCRTLNSTEHSEEMEKNVKLRMMWIGVNLAFCCGGILGAILSHYRVDLLGRKWTLVTNNAGAIVGGILQGIAYPTSSYAAFIIGRIFVGINAGVSTAVAPVYFMGLVPPSLAGAFGALQRLFDVCGTLLAFVLGLPSILGGPTTWPYLVGFVVIPATLQLLVLPMCPEDPKYLSEAEGHEGEAEAVVRQLRHSPSKIEEELREMREKEKQAEQQPKWKFTDMMHDPTLRIVVLVGFVVISCRQLTGINAAYFFSTAIFESAGLTGTSPLYGTVGVGATMVIATLLTALLVEKLGRRPLLLTGLCGTALTTALLTTFIVLHETASEKSQNPKEFSSIQADWAPFVSMAVLFVYLIVYSCGPGTIPSFMIAEMFHEKDKTIANSVELLVHWTCGALVVVAFPLLQGKIHGYVFIFFTVLSIFYIVIVVLWLPETKKQEPEQVQEQVAKRVRKCICKPH